MPVEGRRPDRWLRERIYEILEQADRPLSATTLTHRLAAEGVSVKHSAVFRAVGQLFAAGALDRVELTSAYVPRREETSATALCFRCGAYSELREAAPVDDLRSLARACGFEPSRMVVEVHGLCSSCVVRPVATGEKQRPDASQRS